MTDSKLIVASVRLPVRLLHRKGDWDVMPSPGGLATALRAVAQERSFVWVGWPGEFIARGMRDSATSLLAPHGKPVFLTEKEYHGFYEQLSNRLLWPLFHNISGRLRFDREGWRHYQRVNERFAAAVLDVAKPDDTVWVHDYQLSLVPQLLRERGLDCAIGFFLHIPFPSHETYRTLPVREQLLRGILGADLIGFHTYEFAQHFRNSCLRVLGLESEQETIALSSHLAHLGVHPIGVDPEEIRDFTCLTAVQAELMELKKQFRGKKVVLGVDRLELAFEELLKNNPKWRSRSVLIQVASPSRTGVREYQNLKREVDELVGRINGEFGSFGHTPIVYINQTVPRARLTALYQIADVAFITPLRDGMNLVALEYVAARGERPGALILSEFTGAASCLAGARLVNPHNTSGMADVLLEVLGDTEWAGAAFPQMRDFVASNTAAVWADRFLSQLAKLHENQRYGAERLDFSTESNACGGLGSALFILDYAGTLHPHVPILSETAPSSRLRLLLTKLAERAEVYVMSGQPPEVLDAWFDDIPIGLVCEDGLAVKDPSGEWPANPASDRSLLDELVEPVMRDFYNHTPGSRIEHRTASLAWRFRLADPRLGPRRAKELYSQLEDLIRGSRYTVVANKRAVEVRPAAFTKTSVAGDLLRRHPNAEFVFCAGNDRLDEDMFEVVLRCERPSVFTCFVGAKDTVGQYFVESTEELVDQLEALVRSWSLTEVPG
jgi:trehalose 6-phosphate synthase/phosphatase